MTEHLSFTKAAEASGSDKYHHHGYHRFYPRHLDCFCETAGNLVEIGVDKGRSLQLWRNYLPRAYIHGVDINMELKGDGFIVHRCDQGDKVQLERLARKIGSAFAVIDDGSHIPEHQLLSLSVLFDQVLLPGGVYIIEDIEISYWRRGSLYGYPVRYGPYDSRSTMAVMRLLTDWLNREFLSDADRGALLARLLDGGIAEQVCNSVASIEFAHNCVILRKVEAWEKAFSDRRYKFAENV
jgi:hypothetical protein